MTLSYRLRVELVDQPGALSRITGILAACGADVISVDIHDHDQGRAIDEIVVRVPEGWTPGAVAEALAGQGAGRLLDASAAGPRVDGVARTLRWVRFAVESGAQSSDLELARLIAEICPGVTAMVVSPDIAAAHEAAQQALAGGSPVVCFTEPLPAELAGPDAGDGWLLAVADDAELPRLVALVARSAELRFTATEVQRIEALVQLHRELAARLGRTGDSGEPPDAPDG